MASTEPETSEMRQKFDTFMDKIKQGKLSQKGSLTVASSTLSILRVLIEESNWQSVQELMNLVKHEGKNLILQCGQTATTSIIGNIIRRVLKLIREEASSSGEDEEAESLRMSITANVRHDSFR